MKNKVPAEIFSAVRFYWGGKDVIGLGIDGPTFLTEGDNSPVEAYPEGNPQGKDRKAGRVRTKVDRERLPRWVRSGARTRESEDRRSALCYRISIAAQYGIRRNAVDLWNRSRDVLNGQSGALSECWHKEDRNPTQRKSTAPRKSRDHRELANRRVAVEARIAHLKLKGLGRSRMKTDAGDLISGYRSALACNLGHLMRDLALKPTALTQ